MFKEGQDMIRFFKQSFATFTIISFLLIGVGTPALIVTAASGDTIVYITKTGECYHTSGCSSLRKSKIETTLQNAVSKGLRPCSKCKPGSLDSGSSASSTPTSTSIAPAAVSTTKQSTVATTSLALDPAVEALKTYKGNTKDFDAYTYYMSNADLQTAIGADGDALLKHYNKYGKKEGRVAISSNKNAAIDSVSQEVEALKTYKGNTKSFNAYTYYINNTDLQTAIGANGDALLKHYNEYGKAEGRVAK